MSACACVRERERYVPLLNGKTSGMYFTANLKQKIMPCKQIQIITINKLSSCGVYHTNTSVILLFKWCQFPYVQECLTFTNEECAYKNFAFRFCNGNGRTAVAEYKQCFPNRWVPHLTIFCNVHRLNKREREVTYFSWGNAEREQQQCDKTMYFVHFSEAHIQMYVGLPWRLVFHDHYH
jgi:hypothetical protein